MAVETKSSDIAKVVMDVTDGEVRSVSADRPVEFVITDYGDDNLKEAVRDSTGPEDLPVIPNDLNNLDEAESAGTFESLTATVDEEYVKDVHDYTGSNDQVAAYAKTFLSIFENNGGEIEDGEDEEA